MSPILYADFDIISSTCTRDVQFIAPFPSVSNSTGYHVTYLDTTGRPVLTFQYKDLTVKNAENILVRI